MSNVLEFLIKAKDLTGSALSKVGSGFKKLGTSIGSYIKKAALAFVAFTVASVKLYADSYEMEDKLGKIFGNLADDARNFADAIAKSMRKSREQMRSMIVEGGDLAHGIGLSGEQALDFAKSVTTLTQDLSSFKNINSAEVFDTIHRAVVGNLRSLKQMGIIITEDEIKQKALTMGFFKGEKTLTTQAKALTILTLLQEKSTEATGDAEKSSGSLFNRMKYLIGSFRDLTIEYGNQVASGLNLSGVFGKIGDKFVELREKLEKSGAVEKIFEGLAKSLTPVINLVNDILAGDWEKAKKDWEILRDDIVAKFKEGFSVIKAEFLKITKSPEFQAFASELGKDIVGGIVEGVKEGVIKAWNLLTELNAKGMEKTVKEWRTTLGLKSPTAALDEQMDKLKRKIEGSSANPIKREKMGKIAEKYGFNIGSFEKLTGMRRSDLAGTEPGLQTEIIANSIRDRLQQGMISKQEMGTPEAIAILDELRGIHKDLGAK